MDQVWSETTALNTARDLLTSSGNTNTAVLAFAGRNPPTLYGRTEEWNGSTWTELNDMSTARVSLAST